MSVLGPDNRAQAHETNRESKFYPVRDLDGAARVLAESWSSSSAAERLDRCDKPKPRDKQYHSAFKAAATMTQVCMKTFDRWQLIGFDSHNLLFLFDHYAIKILHMLLFFFSTLLAG